MASLGGEQGPPAGTQKRIDMRSDADSAVRDGAGAGPQDRKVPVTIVTGFLGSGKTTLLKHVLSAKHGRRIAVIENEFGDERGIERLIAKGDTEAGETPIDLGAMFVELSNGCICCTVRDDLVVTLENLLKVRDKFDYILIETTGVADPGPLVGVFWLDEELGSRLYLDGVVTVVDSLNLVKHLDDPRKQAGSREGKGPGNGTEEQHGGTANYVNEAQKQIAYADRVLLNKQDLVSKEQAANITSRVQQINPFAKSIQTKFSQVDLGEILDVRGYKYVHDMQPSEFQRELLALEPQLANGRVHNHAHSHDKDGTAPCSACEEEAAQQNDHSHDPSVQSCVVRTDAGLDLKKFQRWVGELLWEQQIPGKQEIFRIKGCINVHDSDHVHIIQAVHETFEIEPSKQRWGSGEFSKRQSRIVFIGRGVNVDDLTNGVKSSSC